MSYWGSRRLLSHLPELDSQVSHHLHYTQLEDRNFHIHGRTLFYLFILFSIVLLATLLLLYARWFFRFRHLRTITPHLPTTTTTPAKGLDPALINAMPIILHQQQKNDDDDDDERECCICLGVFEEGDKVKVLCECEHRFHSHCLDLWLTTHPTCPLCRLSLLIPTPTTTTTTTTSPPS